MVSQRVGVTAALAANDRGGGPVSPTPDATLDRHIDEEEPAELKAYELTPRGTSEPPQGAKKQRVVSHIVSPGQNRLAQAEDVRQSYDPQN